MKYEGSYTVEAAWIVSMTVIIILFSIQLGFQMYQQTARFIENKCELSEIDIVKQFRTIAFGKELYEEIME